MSKNKVHDKQHSSSNSAGGFTANAITEQSSLHTDLEKKTVAQLLSAMNDEDKKVPFAVEKVLPEIEKLVVQIVERMLVGGRIFYVGAGTSGRLGVLDASEIPPTFGMSPHLVVGLIAGGDRALRNPVENAEDDKTQAWKELMKHHLNENDTVIGIAASGSTPYVVGALRSARKYGILTAAVTCNPNSTVANEADIKIEVVVGPEFITGSTRLKSGTAQKLVLNMITTVTMIKLGRVKGNKMVNMQLSNAKLIDRGTHMLIKELGIEYDQAKEILLQHGSVQKAIDEFLK